MDHHNNDYSVISRTAKVYTIESYHNANDLILVAKIVHDDLNVPEIKNKFVDWNVFNDSRSIRPLQVRINQLDVVKYLTLHQATV